MIVFHVQTASAHKKVWSEATSATLFNLTSYKDLLNFDAMQMWSNCFPVLLSGETHDILCTFVWGKTLPPVTSLLKKQKSANSSPFSFIFPISCFLKTVSKPELSLPTLTLPSPSNRSRSLLASPSITLSVITSQRKQLLLRRQLRL